MFPTGRKASCVIAMFLITFQASCVTAPPPSVESCRLTMTDLEVLRVGMHGFSRRWSLSPLRLVIVLTTSTPDNPRLAAATGRPAILAAARSATVCRAGPSRRVHQPQGSPKRSLDVAVLSPPERAAWERRNRVAREMPGLAIARLGNRHSANEIPAGWTVVAAGTLRIRQVILRCCTRTTPVAEAAEKGG